MFCFVDELSEQPVKTTGVRRRRHKHRVRNDETVEIMSPSPESTVESVTTIDEDSTSSKTCKEKVSEWMTTARLYFQDVANSLTNFLNETSVDYRYITSQLALERLERARTYSMSQTDNVVHNENIEETDDETKDDDQPEVFSLFF